MSKMVHNPSSPSANAEGDDYAIRMLHQITLYCNHQSIFSV